MFTSGSGRAEKNNLNVTNDAWSTTLTTTDFDGLSGSQDVFAGTVTITGTVTDSADINSATTTRSFVYDTQRPRVSTVNYYESYNDDTRSLSNAIAANAVLAAEDDIYTKVVFNEDLMQTTGTGGTAQPIISYKVGTTKEFQYEIVGQGETLTSGKCKPNSTLETDEYVCYYNVVSGDNGAFTVKVGTATADKAGNTFVTDYTHGTTLTTNTGKPGVESVVYSIAAGGAAVTSIRPGNAVYTKIVFDEVVQDKDSNGPTARPTIKGKAVKGAGANATTTIAEFQYDIVPPNADLRSDDCKPTGSGNTAGREYTCRYDTSASLTGTNVYKTFVTAFQDTGGNEGKRRRTAMRKCRA